MHKEIDFDVLYHSYRHDPALKAIEVGQKFSRSISRIPGQLLSFVLSINQCFMVFIL